jgi:hypothetical protein
MTHPAHIGEDSSSPLSPSPSDADQSAPSSSFASDKENRSSSRVHPSRPEKRKRNLQTISSQNMPPVTGSASSKRRRLAEKGMGAQDSLTTHKRRLQLVNDTDFYDPDQDPEERRAVRKGLRELARDLNGNRPSPPWLCTC